MSDADRKALVMVLRSLINSRKNASINDLVRDYMETEGRPIPFQQYGFQRLDQFLVASGEFQVTANRMIFARTTEASEHISKLVAEQNSSKKPKKKMALPMRRPPFNNGYTPQYPIAPRPPQPNVYSNAYQNLKSRSPTKVPVKQPVYHQKYQDYVKHLNQPKSTALPLHMSKPSFVVTFDGLKPANELARQLSRESDDQQNGGAKPTQCAPTPPQHPRVDASKDLQEPIKPIVVHQPIQTVAPPSSMQQHSRNDAPQQHPRIETPQQHMRTEAPQQHPRVQPPQQHPRFKALKDLQEPIKPIVLHQPTQTAAAPPPSIAVPLTKKSIHERILPPPSPMVPLKITITNNNNQQVPNYDLRNRMKKPTESNFKYGGGTIDLQNRLVIRKTLPSPPYISDESIIDLTGSSSSTSKINDRLKRCQISNCDMSANLVAEDVVVPKMECKGLAKNGNASVSITLYLCSKINIIFFYILRIFCRFRLQCLLWPT